MSKITHSLALSLLTLTMSGSALALSAQTNNGSSLSGLLAQKSKTKFLPVHQAFNVSTIQKDDVLSVVFKVTPEHYIYKDNLKLTLPEGVTAGVWTFNKTATMIDDPEFGRVAVFEEDVTATIKLSASAEVTAPVKIRWQGCAKAGLCYPPETVTTTINIKAGTTNDSDGKVKTGSQTKTVTPSTNDDTKKTSTSNDLVNALQTKSVSSASKSELLSQPSSSGTNYQHGEASQSNQPSDEATADTKLMTSPAIAAVSPSTNSSEIKVFGTAQDDGGAHEQSSQEASNHALSTDVTSATNNHQALLGNTDPFGIQKNPILAVLLLFLAGLLLSFTPCVYPMIPIVANIVAHSKSQSAIRGLMLSGGYGLGVASAYGALGALIAGLGQAVGILGWLQNPYVLGVFAIIFALLALYMFDIIKINLPAGVRNLLHQKSQAADAKLGSVGGSFVAGALSALVVSPCVSAPMAGALTAVSAVGSVPFGFIALFSLGLGLSLPLMFIGLAQGKFMPKAGEWMNRVKEFCGLLLLAVSLSLLERLFISPIMLIIWAAWFAIVAIWLFRMQNLASQGFALVSAIWTMCLIVGASMGSSDAWRPLAVMTDAQADTSLASSRPDLHITTLNELDVILTKHDKVLVDVTADWCVECRIMERTLFTNRPAALRDYQVVKLDVTETNDDSRAVLSRYQLFGPPALLIYKNNQLQTIMLGEVARDDFETTLAQF